MKKLYKYYCTIEEVLVGIMFMAIVSLTFMNAVLRIFNKPIVYADDTCLLLFSWTALMGADVSMRRCRLVGMDILTSKMPQKTQKILGIIVNIIIIGMLLILIKGGLKIIKINGDRPFNTLEVFGISYGYVTAAIPICCAMMILTSIIKTVKLVMHFGDDNFTLKKEIAAENAQLGEENAGVGEEAIVFDDTKEANK